MLQLVIYSLFVMVEVIHNFLNLLSVRIEHRLNFRIMVIRLALRVSRFDLLFNFSQSIPKLVHLERVQPLIYLLLSPIKSLLSFI